MTVTENGLFVNAPVVVHGRIKGTEFRTQRIFSVSGINYSKTFNLLELHIPLISIYSPKSTFQVHVTEAAIIQLIFPWSRNSHFFQTSSILGRKSSDFFFTGLCKSQLIDQLSLTPLDHYIQKAFVCFSWRRIISHCPQTVSMAIRDHYLSRTNFVHNNFSFPYLTQHKVLIFKSLHTFATILLNLRSCQVLLTALSSTVKAFRRTSLPKLKCRPVLNIKHPLLNSKKSWSHTKTWWDLLVGLAFMSKRTWE